MSREEIDQANNVLQTVLHQLAKAQATRDLAKLDLERTVIRAPADGWVTNLNVYTGEFITRGSTAVALVKQNSFYVLAYMEETKLEGVRSGYRAEITPLGSNKVLKGLLIVLPQGSPMPAARVTTKGWRPSTLTLNGYVWRNVFRYVFVSTTSKRTSGLRAPLLRW